GCYLGKKSKIGKESEGDFAVGESAHKLVYGVGDDYSKWPFVARATGKFDSYKVGDKEIKFHNEYAFSLPCYENMQGDGVSKRQDADGDGVIDHPNSNDPNDPIDGDHYKDGKPGGTYIEVEGYYLSNTNDNISRGPIKYRFMLGKNVDDNYDVERNHHYKITMAFKGNGNEVDWHIEYKERTPEIYTPDIYASYSYNEAVTIPVRIVGGRVLSLKAEIIENNWHPEVEDGDNLGNSVYFTNAAASVYSTWDSGAQAAYQKYFSYIDDGTKHLGNGFLSLYARDDDANEIISPYTNSDKQTFAYNQWYWDGKENTDLGGSGKLIKTGAGLGKSIGVREYAGGEYFADLNESRINVEAYTRQKCLVKHTGYSGANLYETGNRIARVKLTAIVDVDGSPVEVLDTVKVEQSRRLVNPAGIYRSANNNASFHVNLKVAEVEPSTPENIDGGTYRPLRSRGPWRAEIENVGDPGMISISRTWGDHDSEIDFDVTFNATSKNPSFAIISIYYHNYACHHRIFVRKGYNASAVIDGGVKWHAGNAAYRANSKIYDVEDPIDEGSMFRYANLATAISSRNNYKYTFNNSIINGASLEIKERTYYASSTWDDISSPNNLSGTTNNGVPAYSLIEAYNVGSGKTPVAHTTYNAAKTAGKALVESMTTRPAAYADFYDLYKSPDVAYAYGVVYGDDATETSEDMSVAYGHDSDYGNTSGHGMRAVIVYNKNDARHV
ncbi:MAG: hypothetical protein K2M98_07405, partial [Muribaculum sp.]|nr:hypothetical protein [Muribaculum sp.]